MYCTKINSQNKKNKKKLAGLKVTNAGGGEKLIEFKFSSCLPRPFFIRGCDELSPDKTKSVDWTLKHRHKATRPIREDAGDFGPAKGSSLVQCFPSFIDPCFTWGKISPHAAITKTSHKHTAQNVSVSSVNNFVNELSQMRSFPANWESPL